MIYVHFNYNLTHNARLYLIGGTIISIILLVLLLKNKKYGFIGTTLFYIIQIFGTDMIFENFRYGLILRIHGGLLPFEILPFDLNITAILLVSISYLGYKSTKKINVI